MLLGIYSKQKNITGKLVNDMMLVTLGTQHQQFSRLLTYIEEADIDDEIIVQAGHTKFESKKMKIFDFIDYDKMNQYIDMADIIITHAGTGSILSPLKKKKTVIACPRKQEYGEHIDNHQEEIVNVFFSEGYILKLDENSELNTLLKEAKKFKPKKFFSNTSQFRDKLIREINE